MVRSFLLLFLLVAGLASAENDAAADRQATRLQLQLRHSEFDARISSMRDDSGRLTLIHDNLEPSYRSASDRYC